MTTLHFPSSNSLGVPDLLLGEVDACPPAVPAPLVTWGAISRRSAMPGMWLFYVDDYRFAGLWSDPDALLRTTAVAAAEVNFTIGEDTPRAEALWHLYRKRWLSRYWQAHQVSVWVDVHVAHAHESVALLGVPTGWQRWVTSGMGRTVHELDHELAMVVEHTCGNPYTLLVYGGGAASEQWCAGRANVVHIKHRTHGTRKLGMRTRDRIRNEGAK